MANKIYKVIKQEVCIETLTKTVEVQVFTDDKLALSYFQKLSKKDLDSLDSYDDYTIAVGDTTYERHLSGREIEESISISMEEDVLDNDKLFEKEEKEYELDTP